jgi:hypothetical protein
MNKYAPLHQRLSLERGAMVALSFADLDLLVSGLPQSARHDRTWWVTPRTVVEFRRTRGCLLAGSSTL